MCFMTIDSVSVCQYFPIAFHFPLDMTVLVLLARCSWTYTWNLKCQRKFPREVWDKKQQQQQNFQVDPGILPDTTTPRRHLGCHSSWGAEPTGANMAVYPCSVRHLLQGSSGLGDSICSNSPNPFNMVPQRYSMASWQGKLKGKFSKHLPIIKCNQGNNWKEEKWRE